MKRILISLVMSIAIFISGISQKCSCPKLGKDPVKKVIAAIDAGRKSIAGCRNGMRMPGGPPPSSNAKLLQIHPQIPQPVHYRTTKTLVDDTPQDISSFTIGVIPDAVEHTDVPAGPSTRVFVCPITGPVGGLRVDLQEPLHWKKEVVLRAFSFRFDNQRCFFFQRHCCNNLFLQGPYPVFWATAFCEDS